MPKQKLHLIKVTKEDLKALGFTNPPSWSFDEDTSKSTSSVAILGADAHEISLDNGCIAEALVDKNCTVLHLLVAAYSSGFRHGADHALHKVRRTLGLIKAYY